MWSFSKDSNLFWEVFSSYFRRSHSFFNVFMSLALSWQQLMSSWTKEINSERDKLKNTLSSPSKSESEVDSYYVFEGVMAIRARFAYPSSFYNPSSLSSSSHVVIRLFWIYFWSYPFGSFLSLIIPSTYKDNQLWSDQTSYSWNNSSGHQLCL